ncbi:coproporphyrinogen III oxidase family protein [bacterium D16-51]|nr:coproporphyrinogen III oxidase family protein [bacterium D16-59]RKI59142.1 coproporphyrinogen III oxidase family protein [bacterium D16-51]
MQNQNPYQQYMYSYPHKTAYSTLSNIHLQDYFPYLDGAKNSLYFHIPFCQYKCGYCNLFSVTGQTEHAMEQYINAMKRHAKQLSQSLPTGTKFCDLTLGGGTPLILSIPQLQKVFSLAKNYFQFDSGNFPIVIETSPNQTTPEKLELLKEEGVTRISIGVQSFQETELAVLHRFHHAASACKALDAIKDKDFDCLNIDIIYGIPGQTTKSLLDSLSQALAFEPEELFVYPLYIKPGTVLYQENCRCSTNAMEMYRQARDFLKSAGYQPWSMRRFVKTSTPSLPESSCGFGNTLSIGCGGRSYIGNLHFCMPYAVKQENCLSILETYILEKDYLKISHGFLLPPEEQKRRYVIRHILFGKGISLAEYKNHFSEDVRKDFPILSEWEKNNYAAAADGYITLTEEGFCLSDYLGPQLISPDIQEKMDAFERKKK